ncbi:unnamed protein product [Cylicocyclus nassatus]|uniref:Uncharacterized protein n=1 Tax=Cylicocyclus nassatus TaxID=53992 RepID=A0AA36MDX9_CYLNA|nr:unnamed protein product [Cylicocyclus nassatus]
MNPYRVERFIEGVHKRVMNEYIRIVNIPISMRKELSLMLEDFVVIVGYDKDRERDYNPLSWPRPAGIGASTMCLQAKVTYKFWRYFTSLGKTKLGEYNREHQTNIVVVQEKTLRMNDQNRLCLFLRNLIKEKYREKQKSPIDMKIKQWRIELVGVGVFDPVILARRLDFDYRNWNGLPFDEIIDYRIKKDSLGGKLPIGPLTLPGLEENREAESESYSEVVNRKRSHKDKTRLLRALVLLKVRVL